MTPTVNFRSHLTPEMNIWVHTPTTLCSLSALPLSSLSFGSSTACKIHSTAPLQQKKTMETRREIRASWCKMSAVGEIRASWTSQKLENKKLLEGLSWPYSTDVTRLFCQGRTTFRPQWIRIMSTTEQSVLDGMPRAGDRVGLERRMASRRSCLRATASKAHVRPVASRCEPVAVPLSLADNVLFSGLDASEGLDSVPSAFPQGNRSASILSWA